MNVYSYIVAVDSGFAPNPFFGCCTLACCKPVIRRTASCGDWIVGLAPKRSGHGIVYAMKVTEKMSMADYWRDRRFRRKRPKRDRKEIIRRGGDNIYRPLQDGKFLQIPSGHSKEDGKEDLQNKKRDLSGKNVLVSRQYCYYGGETRNLPKRFEDLIAGRGHKRLRCETTIGAKRCGNMVDRLVRFLEGLPAGVHGKPNRWPKDDESWDDEGSVTSGGRCR